jgi:hypothetical protein
MHLYRLGSRQLGSKTHTILPRSSLSVNFPVNAKRLWGQAEEAGYLRIDDDSPCGKEHYPDDDRRPI